jgi:hypothetical protein
MYERTAPLEAAFWIQLLSTSFLDSWQEIADAYNTRPLVDESALSSWQSLARDSRRWADRVRRRLDVIVVDNAEPYDSRSDMCADIETHKRFLVSRVNCEHPVWTPEENIAFRIVHDVLGHCRSGGEFSWTGENLAFAHHALTVRAVSLCALFTEVVGQTAVYKTERTHAVQKVAILHEFIDPILKHPAFTASLALARLSERGGECV